MATSKINNFIHYTEGSVAFTNGNGTIDAESGYKLIAIYPIERPTTESNTYAIVSMQEATDGKWHLKNQSSNTFGITCRAVWMKSS